MGSELYASFVSFAESLDATCALLDPLLGRSLRELMFAAEGSPEAALLDHTEIAQPALFALEVALFRLLESLGCSPQHLIGHSVGELAAAHVAGVLSLADACTLVEARGRLMAELTERGEMLALQATEQEAGDSLVGFESDVALAAVNGPSSVVLSGRTAVIDQLESTWAERGRKLKRLRVSNAFHSPLMEPMLGRFAAIAESLSFKQAQIPIVSSLTGRRLEQEMGSAEYWVRQVRGTVRFRDGLTAMHEAGVTRLVELGPDGVLCAMASECFEQASEQVLTAPLMRTRCGEGEAMIGALADLHTHGVPIGWRALFEGRGADRVPLPTYAFQRNRHWLELPAGAGDLSAAGVRSAEHPLLGAAIHLAREDEWVFTARLSSSTHPWLADHVLLGSIVVPGTAYVDLVLSAGATIGCATLEELTLLAPLVLEEDHAVELQLSVGAPTQPGRRDFTIHSRPAAGEDGEETPWTRHASGYVAAAVQSPSAALERLEAEAWPPIGAEVIDVDGVYDRLAAVGYDYGPSFAGIRAAWLRGEEIFTEVALGGELLDEAARFGVHPALFDAVVQAGAVLEPRDTAGVEPGRGRMLFSWGGTRCLSGGATSLRVRLAPAGDSAWSIAATDEQGVPVLSVDSLAHRPIEASQLLAARKHTQGSLLCMSWSGLALPAAAPPPSIAVLGPLELSAVDTQRYDGIGELIATLDAGAASPQVVLAPLASDSDAGEPAQSSLIATRTALELLQSWLSEERLLATQLVLVSSAAVAVLDGETPDGPTASAYGLIRSAQSEHPARFVLADVDGSEASWRTLIAALSASEPQLALRDGAAFVPRFERLEDSAVSMAKAAFDTNGTVLITGGTGGLGGLLACHLAQMYGVRHLLLTSRSGALAEGVEELRGELSSLGCEVTVAACDAGERGAMAELLGTIPEDHPLDAVVHAAGVLDDALIEGMTIEQLDCTMRSKADAAWHLHELTKDMGLSQFVLFSSIAAGLGAPGQANYAAANSHLDALAQIRRAQGLAGKSMAWGPWRDAGMTRERTDGDLARMRRSGILALPSETALELFDTALASETPVLAPVGLDGARLRALAGEGTLANLFWEIVPASTRGARETVSLAHRLSSTPEQKRQEVVLELVLEQVASVLGLASAREIEPRRPFIELGFDSLDAVELRNRLISATRLKLPATLMFDHPTPAAVAEHVHARVAEQAPKPMQARLEDELQRVESLLGSIGTDDGVYAQAEQPLRSFMGRLQAFLASFEHSGDDDLESASDDEMFELIDREFGP